MLACCFCSAFENLASQGMDFPKPDLDQTKSLDEPFEDMRPPFVQQAEAAKKMAPAAVDSEQEVRRRDDEQEVSKRSARVKQQDPDPGAEFEIEVRRRDDEPVGMDLDLIDGVTPLVVSTKAGTIQEWNTQHPALAVKAGDRIHEVNGVRNDTSGIISTLKESADWKIVLQRPRELVLNLRKKHDCAPSLGLTLSYAKNGSTVLVTEVNEGPVLDWNFENVEYQVQAFDRIVEVNGNRGRAVELLRHIEDSDQICMKVLHYPKLLRYDSDSDCDAMN